MIVEPSISIRNLNIEFQNQVILSGVNIDFYAGKIYGIIGRNGSGKTVLLKCICGILEATHGSIIVNQKVIGKDVDFPEGIGFIIETPGFLPNYSGFKNLLYLASIRGIVDKETIRTSMAIVGLNPDERKNVGKYSLGMRQRLGIAQAIMESPDILILDEPMNSLDEDGVDEMRTLILKMKCAKKLIILTSHNKEDIDKLCDEVYQMKGGTLEKLSRSEL